MGTTTIARFTAKYEVDVESGCWMWKASVSGSGYGQFVTPGGRERLAHRFSFSHYVEQIPPGLVIDHTCKNKLCVNPAHLEAVTQRENLMRSPTTTRRNALATHCPANHAYDELNTYVDGLGFRHCRSCRRIQAAARRAA